jgi:hypothetical protein
MFRQDASAGYDLQATAHPRFNATNAIDRPNRASTAQHSLDPCFQQAPRTCAGIRDFIQSAVKHHMLQSNAAVEG